MRRFCVSVGVASVCDTLRERREAHRTPFGKLRVASRREGIASDQSFRVTKLKISQSRKKRKN